MKFRSSVQRSLVGWAMAALVLLLLASFDLAPHLARLVREPIDPTLAGQVVGDLSRIAGVMLSMLAVLCALRDGGFGVRELDRVVDRTLVESGLLAQAQTGAGDLFALSPDELVA